MLDHLRWSEIGCTSYIFIGSLGLHMEIKKHNYCNILSFLMNEFNEFREIFMVVELAVHSPHAIRLAFRLADIPAVQQNRLPCQLAIHRLSRRLYWQSGLVLPVG
jgi:hypothetical protein